ncbi:MAG: hypothetical protein ACOVP1_03110 [Bacteroidia bacterium]
MMNVKKTIIPIFVSGIWISISEFLRNQLFFKSYWLDHYLSLGMKFPEAPENGMIWGLWSMVYAAVLFVLMKRFTLQESFLLGWVIGFLMMWLVIGNLGVLPMNLLIFAIPLSLLETYLACLIIQKLS